MGHKCLRGLMLAMTVIACLAVRPAGSARAACNTMQVTEFSGSYGKIDSAFLLPSATRMITGLVPFAAGDVVSIAYQRPSNGKLFMIVLSGSCADWLETVCQSVVPELPVVLCDDVSPTVSADQSTISFKVPAFDDEIGTEGQTHPVPANRAKTYPTGPVRLMVSSSAASACKYAKPSQACPTGANADLKACIDTLDTKPGVPENESIARVTALPWFNDFSEICDEPGGKHGCKGNARELALALDAAGNMLIPMQWTSVLRDKDDDTKDCNPANPKCAKRAVTAWTPLEAKASQPHEPIKIPASDPDALQSFNELGETFPVPERPEFVVDTSSTDKEFELKGTADKHYSVLRIRRCPTGQPNCDATTSYFELGDRMDDSIGPVKVKKEKVCDEPLHPVCKRNKDCTVSGRCRNTGGTVGQWITMSPPPSPPPPPPPDSGSAAWAYWLLLLAALGLAWYWWGRGS